METVIKIIEIFAFATGIAYLILEIMQHNFMWIIGIATVLATGFFQRCNDFIGQIPGSCILRLIAECNVKGG